MVNNKIVVLFGVLASGMALSPQKIPWVPKAVVKGFGAGVLTFSLWNVQPSNGVMLEDAMILNEAADQVIKSNNPTKVESPYPQLTPREKKRLKEKDAEEQRKMNELVRNKDLDKAKNEINQNTDKKIEEVNSKIDGVNSKIDGVNSKIDTTFGLTFFTLLRMIYFKWAEIAISRGKVKLEQEALKLKNAEIKLKQDEADAKKQEQVEDKAK